MEAARTLSSEFLQHASVEREALLGRLGALRERAASLSHQLRECESEIDDVSSLVREIEDLLGVSPQLSLQVPAYRIGGKALREAALSVLREHNPPEPVHYRDWFSWVEDAGYRVGGENPMATFLAQISQDDRIERVGSKSGRYRLSSGWDIADAD